MSVDVRLPTILRPSAGGEAVVSAQGATVALSGTRRDALEAVAEKLGSDHKVLTCNLGDSASVEALITTRACATSSSPRTAACTATSTCT